MTYNTDTNYSGRCECASRPDRGTLLTAAILGTLISTASIIILFFPIL